MLKGLKDGEGFFRSMNDRKSKLNRNAYALSANSEIAAGTQCPALDLRGQRKMVDGMSTAFEIARHG